ncbi:phage tail protein [Streptococcus suis]|uniref:phage tail protein n=1 Tax=Streptococcus suis TaxID=1307 RepID=UPI000942F27B|nr:phage tail protein [Streptococcus suis]MBS8087420.1 phage tail protein [Streptococcus suis]MBS8110932.1 phage tail protein [Streptococcus suis]MCB2924530.1 phage tail protein [Streptococcus suis]NQK29393.1 phage tail protein [Streptococcus suis]NQK96176.1 phage tail protein [Streptococcus suis]
MIRHNELVIDGVKTSSFPFKVIVHESPSVTLGDSKTNLLEHDGISGAIVQTNKHRRLIEKSYTIYLVKPTEEQLNKFMSLFIREKFWLENERVKTTRLWCYKASTTDAEQEKPGLYVTKVTFTCHPTKFFKATDTQTLTGSGVLRVQGSALAFPKITVVGQSASETSFTVGNQVIKLEKLSESLVMTNDPDNPSFKTATGKLIKWAGDFITVDTAKGQNVGVVLGPGIQSLKFETVWGWA